MSAINQPPKATVANTFRPRRQALLVIAGLLALLTAVFVFPLLAVVLFGIALGLVFFALPHQALWLTILLIPLTAGMRRFGIMRPDEILLAACFALVTLVALKRGRLLRLDRRIDPWFLLFLLFASLLPLTVYIVREGTISSAIVPYLAPWQHYLLFRAVSWMARDERHVQRYLQALVLAGVALALVSLLQAIGFGPVQRLLEAYFPSAHLELINLVGYSRTTSLLGNWHGVGVYYAFTLLTIATAWIFSKRLFPMLLTIGFVLLLALGLVSTNSFTSVGVLAIGLLVLAVASGRLTSTRLWIGLGAMIVGLGIVGVIFREWIQEQIAFQFSSFAYGYGYVERSIPFLPRTVANRLISWNEQFGPVIAETWFLGYGPQLPDVGAQSDDSQYIYMLLKGGILYVLAFLALIGALLRATWVRYRRAAPRSWARITHLLGFTLLMALQPAFVLQAYFTYAGVADYLWVVLGLSSGIALAQTSTLHSSADTIS
jgi:hypothetical protein